MSATGIVVVSEWGLEAGVLESSIQRFSDQSEMVSAMTSANSARRP